MHVPFFTPFTIELRATEQRLREDFATETDSFAPFGIFKPTRLARVDTLSVFPLLSVGRNFSSFTVIVGAEWV